MQLPSSRRSREGPRGRHGRRGSGRGPCAREGGPVARRAACRLQQPRVSLQTYFFIPCEAGTHGPLSRSRPGELAIASSIPIWSASSVAYRNASFHSGFHVGHRRFSTTCGVSRLASKLWKPPMPTRYAYPFQVELDAFLRDVSPFIQCHHTRGLAAVAGGMAKPWMRGSVFSLRTGVDRGRRQGEGGQQLRKGLGKLRPLQFGTVNKSRGTGGHGAKRGLRLPSRLPGGRSLGPILGPSGTLASAAAAGDPFGSKGKLWARRAGFAGPEQSMCNRCCGA